MKIDLETAHKIIDATMKKGRELGLKPLTVAVLDAGGHVKAILRADGASNMRPRMAEGKAYGCLALGLGGGTIQARAEQQPYFTQAMNALADGYLVPVRGGVLVEYEGEIIGAVGVTGDSSENDEACANAGIESVGFSANAG